MKKGEITIKLLETLQGVAEAGINILDLACSGSRGSMYHKAYKTSHCQSEACIQTDWADNYRRRAKLCNLLCHLNREGLVEKRKQGKFSFWKLTKAGKNKLIELKNKNASGNYSPCKKDNKLRIVIFDIFEQDKVKRAWMRKCLSGLGYTLLQKSVWQGYCPLPEEFIKEIDRKGIMDNIHIFEVNKSGTLQKISNGFSNS